MECARFNNKQVAHRYLFKNIHLHWLHSGINNILKLNLSLIFQAPDYYNVITKPMDFSTIRNKINKFMYVDPVEIVQDVRQIFTNCIEYNKRTTPEFKAGANMSKLFEKKLKDMESETVSNGPASKRARTK